MNTDQAAALVLAIKALTRQLMLTGIGLTLAIMFGAWVNWTYRK